ncbi:hypothetical protein BGX28_009085 [Mortierella sp. GBA30]|nr:hypothetical protein BGX28_009085 [Mortierella sp. GBA30]
MPRQRVRKVAHVEPKLYPVFPLISGPMSSASQRMMHLELTGELLRKSLVRRDYNRAYKLYSIMVSSRADLKLEGKGVDFAEELAWKIGAELLRQKTEYEPLCLRFLQLILARTNSCREQVLLEIALYQLRCGMIDQARTTLEPFMSMYPYNENALLLGYAGVVEFALWRKAVLERRRRKLQDPLWTKSSKTNRELNDRALKYSCGGDAQDSEDEWHEGDEEGPQEATALTAKISRHEHTAVNLLEDALERDCRHDMFLTYLVRLKCGRIPPTGFAHCTNLSRRRKAAIQQMVGVLRNFYNKNNNSLLALQLLTALENQQKPQTLKRILEQDPVAHSELYVQPYIQLLIRNMPQTQRDFLEEPPFSQFETIENIEDRWPLQTAQRKLCKGTWQYRVLDFRPELAGICIPSPYPGPDHEQSAESTQKKQLHQPQVKYFRPILRCLLTRAEFGVMTYEQEKSMISICRMFCFCSLYCRRVSKWEDVPLVPRIGSFFDDLPDDRRPAWYNRLAAILSREDE